MKKYILFCLFPLALYTRIPAQQTVHVLVSYLPRHSYYTTFGQNMKLDIDMGGDAGKSNNSKNGDDDSQKSITMKMESETKTGKLYNDSLFSYKTVITRVSGLDAAAPIKTGLSVYGTGSKSGRITLDSVSAEGMDAELREKLLPMLKSTLQQVVAPDHTFKEGESFSFETPFSFPAGGINIDFKLGSTYTLKSVSQGIARFSISNTYTMKSESAVLPITAEGYGTGSMLYDIKNSYFTKYELEYTLNMGISMAGKEMKMGMKNSLVQNVKITKD